MTRLLVTATLGLALLTGCATPMTKIVWSVHPPETTKLVGGRKVLALCVAPDPKVRIAAEDELVKLLADGKAAHTLFKDDELKDTRLVRERLAEQGFTYAVVMRLEGTKVESQTTPAWHSAQDVMWDGYIESWDLDTRTSTQVQVVTRVYAVADGTLLWAAMTESLDPKRVEKTVDEIARAAVERLKADGVVAP